ncbi:PREDICTED: aspartic proteinase CDR1 [Theobroma cacao]|uniref:Aspartic proteinase CDR1 n=1 Tax=Theobroma cacao TaxID=3641 RepID=A0AB32VVV4_THECC|nr:PREDICTED: aspartic proteinase CDR1 [Theobroma cacao]
MEKRQDRSEDFTTDIHAYLDPNHNLFLVNFFIGQPPIPQLAVMDTGSSLLWVQCLLCLPNAPSGMVPYIILQTPQHILDCHAILSVVSFPNVLSPCASRPIHVYTTSFLNGDLQPDKLISGGFGLGCGRTSLATRLGKFSYCIGNVLDPNYNPNKLVMGLTPLEVIDGNYHVLLEGISVGEKKLPIDPNIFRRKGENRSLILVRFLLG